MITLFTEARFVRDKEGGIWTNDVQFQTDQWRWPHGAEHMRIAARVASEDPLEGMRPVVGEVVPIPDFRGPVAGLVRLGKTRRAVLAALSSSTAVIVRVPGMLGSVVLASLPRASVPAAVDLVGDIEGVLTAGSGGRVGRLAAPFARLVIARLIRRADAVRYVTRRYLQGKYPARPGAATVFCWDLALIVDPRPAPRARPGRLITVGSQDQWYKGHDILLEALAELAPDFPDLHCDIVGGGRHHEALRVRAEQLCVSDRVTWHGHVADRARVMALLAQADLFVLPSLTEGLPRALGEAMAKGLPCVASDVGGVSELLQDELALVPAGRPIPLAIAIRRYLTSEAARSEQVEANLRTMADYTPEAQAAAASRWSTIIGELERTGA